MEERPRGSAAAQWDLCLEPPRGREERQGRRMKTLQLQPACLFQTGHNGAFFLL